MILFLLLYFSHALAEPLTISHRGSYNYFVDFDSQGCEVRSLSGETPRIENTIEAVEWAFKRGVYKAEIDIQVTKDGIPVLFHDPKLDCFTDKKGSIREHNFKDIENLKYHFISNGKLLTKKHKLETLESILRKYPNSRFLLNPKVLNLKECQMVITKIDQFLLPEFKPHLLFWGTMEVINNLQASADWPINIVVHAKTSMTCWWGWKKRGGIWGAKIDECQDTLVGIEDKAFAEDNSFIAYMFRRYLENAGSKYVCIQRSKYKQDLCGIYAWANFKILE